MNGLIRGIFTYLNVPNASIKYGLWPYYFLAGGISLILGVGLVYGSYSYGDDLGVWLASFIPWDWGANLVEQAGAWLGRIGILALSLIIYKYIVLVIVAPIMSPLSAKIERRMTGLSTSEKFSILSFTKEMWRGLRIALRNIWREVIFTLLLLILSFVPGFALITTPLIFLVQAYYAGFGNMDYFMERHYSVSGAVQYVRRNRGLAIGNGSIFLLLLTIPFVGFLIAPGISTTAATIAIMKRDPH